LQARRSSAKLQNMPVACFEWRLSALSADAIALHSGVRVAIQRPGWPLNCNRKNTAQHKNLCQTVEKFINICYNYAISLTTRIYKEYRS